MKTLRYDVYKTPCGATGFIAYAEGKTYAVNAYNSPAECNCGHSNCPFDNADFISFCNGFDEAEETMKWYLESVTY